MANKRPVFHVLADSDHLLLFYFPALLCVFSPALVENGIRYIFLEGASPVSIPGLVANIFSALNGKNVYRSSPVHGTFNPSCPAPGILVFNFLINSGYFLHLEVIPSISKGLCIPSHC